MNRQLLHALFGFSLVLSACEKREEAAPPISSAGSVQQEAGAAVDAAEEQAKKMRDAFVSKAQQEMDEMNSKLSELNAKARTLSGEAKVKLDQQIKNLEKEQQESAQKLGELKAATAEKWDALKTGVSESVGRFKQSLKTVKEDSSRSNNLEKLVKPK